MSELNELYQEMILDHNNKPRNFGVLEHPTAKAEGYNPLCGDQLTVFLKLNGDVIEDIRFEGSGCAISKASASLMTTAVKGLKKTEAFSLFEKFHHLVTGKLSAEVEDESLGKLTVFSGVSQFPARVKCASLAWHTLNNALKGEMKVASTEENETTASAPEEPKENPLKSQVIDVLETCYDPEIPVNIYELGLIYDIDVRPTNVVVIKMTLTSPMCPVAGSLPPEVKEKVKRIPGVLDAVVDLVWDPPWKPDRMSEAAKLQLGM